MKHTLKSVRALAATLITLGSLAGGANAAISVTSLGGDSYLANIGIITLTVTSAGTGNVVTVEDFYTGPNTDTSSTPLSSNLTYSVNSSPAISFPLWTNSGSYGAVYGVWDQNDFVFSGPTNIAVNPSDVITFSGTFTFQASGLTLPSSSTLPLTATFTAGDPANNIVLASGLVAVPEPCSTILLGIGGLGVLLRRRRN